MILESDLELRFLSRQAAIIQSMKSGPISLQKSNASTSFCGGSLMHLPQWQCGIGRVIKGPMSVNLVQSMRVFRMKPVLYSLDEVRRRQTGKQKLHWKPSTSCFHYTPMSKAIENVLLNLYTEEKLGSPLSRGVRPSSIAPLERGGQIPLLSGSTTTRCNRSFMRNWHRDSDRKM